MLNISDYEAMAKLDLPQSERDWVAMQVDMLLASFNALNTVETTDVQPLVTVLDAQNVLREDVAVKYMTRDELLSNAPEQYDGYFQVPKTVD